MANIQWTFPTKLFTLSNERQDFLNSHTRICVAHFSFFDSVHIFSLSNGCASPRGSCSPGSVCSDLWYCAKLYCSTTRFSGHNGGKKYVLSIRPKIRPLPPLDFPFFTKHIKLKNIFYSCLGLEFDKVNYLLGKDQQSWQAIV